MEPSKKFNIDTSLQNLHELTSKIEESTAQTQQSLSRTSGKVAAWFTGIWGKMPDWAGEQIALHKLLKNAINELVEVGKEDEIPPEAIAAIEKSEKAVLEIARRVNHTAFLKAILPPKGEPRVNSKGRQLYTDTSGLLTPLDPEALQSHSNMKEWEIHFGLLCSAYQRTDNEDTKATIRFLMTNYLQKAAYLNAGPGMNLSETEMKSYSNMLQLGQMTLGGMYHRTADTMSPTLRILGLENKVGSSRDRSAEVIPTDTINVQDLYVTGFTPITDISKTEEAVDTLVDQFVKHREEFPDSNMEFPILMDITPEIGQSLITDGDPGKIAEYQDKQQAAKTKINEIFNLAAEQIQAKYPDEKEILKKARDYLKINTAIVSRAKITDRVGVIGMHTGIFDDSDFAPVSEDFREIRPRIKRYNFITEKVKQWAGYSAIGVGAVNFRQISAEIKTDPSELAKLGVGRAVKYSVPGKVNVMMYEKPEQILRTNLFKTLTLMAEEKKEPVGKGQALLAKATAKMMKTLLNNISEEDWSDKQQDVAVQELTQNALYRLSLHLSAALNDPKDFRKFSQAIDRAHSELTTLLVLYRPFDVEKFEANYKEFILPLFPDALEPTQVGIAKSAMNVYTGVNAAVLQNTPDPVRICGAHSYYEESQMMGGTLSLDEALENPDIKKVDLYVAEFYHNIDIDPDHTHYQKGTVIEDIRKIFDKKPDTDALTVAIDATIDFAQSSDIQELLKEFEKEIQAGKLNLVIFRSGQKFDMMGLDNYYGSPFYMVNDGGEKWSKFNQIKTEEAFQTDWLSQQFFSWMAASGPELVDEYKNLIFSNTNRILDLVPEGLTPSEGKSVCVSSFEEGVKTPFIDIKIKPDNLDAQDELYRWAQKRFIELFISNEKLVYVRGSFGFPHPNITWIDPKMRINPGVDPSDIPIYKQYFEELEAKAVELLK